MTHSGIYVFSQNIQDKIVKQPIPDMGMIIINICLAVCLFHWASHTQHTDEEMEAQGHKWHVWGRRAKWWSRDSNPGKSDSHSVLFPLCNSCFQHESFKKGGQVLLWKTIFTEQPHCTGNTEVNRALTALQGPAVPAILDRASLLVLCR